MKNCPKCKTEYPDDKMFCKICGVKLISAKETDPKFTAKKMVLEERIKIDPLNISLLNELAELLIENNLYDEAILILYKILAIEDNNLKAQRYLFHCLNAKGKTKEAAEIGYKLVDLFPDNSDLILEVALLAMGEEDHNRALDYFDRIIKIDPNKKNTWKYKATLLSKIGDKSSALDTWSTVYKIDSHDTEAKLYLGVEAAKNGEYSKAKELIESVVKGSKEITQNQFVGLVYLAKSFLNLSPDADNIPDLYAKIFEVNQPDWLDDDQKLVLADIAFALGKKALDKEDYNTALSYFENVGEFGNIKMGKRGCALTYYKMSEGYYNKADLQNAEYYIGESLKHDPTNPEVKEKYSEIIKKIKAGKSKKLRKNIIAFSITALLIIAGYFAITLYLSQKDTSDWEDAKKENTVAAYQKYLNLYPNGKYNSEAYNAQDESLWYESIKSNTVEDYEHYIAKYPNGKHILQAIDKWEDALWVYSKNTNDYRNYIAQYPGGKYINQINSLVNNLDISSNVNLVTPNKLKDISNNNGSNILTNLKSVGFNSGNINNGADLGTGNANKYLYQPNTLGLTCNSPFSMICWVKLNSEITSGNYTFLSIAYGNSGICVDYYLSYAYNGGTRQIFISRDRVGIISNGVSYKVTMGTSNWYQLALTYDGSSLDAYVNGSSIGRVSASGIGNASGSTGFSIGNRIYNGTNYSSANIQDVSVFSRVLSITEMSNCYNTTIKEKPSYLTRKNNSNIGANISDESSNIISSTISHESRPEGTNSLNIALNKPCYISTNGAEKSQDAEFRPQFTDNGNFFGGSKNKLKETGTNSYLSYVLTDGNVESFNGWVNREYNRLMQLNVTINLQDEYDITSIRYNVGKCMRSNTWNADKMITPIGSISTKPGYGNWTEIKGKMTTSKLKITFEKTRVSWETDWLMIGEIEVYGTKVQKR